jgi:hypothetical protein
MAAQVHPIGVPPRATVTDGSIVIDHLTSTSPEAVRTTRAWAARTKQDDVGEHVEMLIDIGGKAVAIGSSTLDVDEVKRSLEKFTADVASAAQASVTDLRAAVDKATDSDDGTIARTVSDALESLVRDINAAVQGEKAPLRVAIGDTVKSVTDKALGEVQRALTAHQKAVHSLLSTDSSDSPLNTLKRDLLNSEHETREDIKAQLSDIKTLVEVAREHKATMAKTAIKGFAYEDQVVEALAELAHGAGDGVEATGSSAGHDGRSKKGDAVITLGEPAAHGHAISIAVEVKDMSLGCDAWRRELDAARKNRAATAALGVAREPAFVPGRKRVHVFGPLDIVVAYDPAEDDPWVLYVVYHLLRTQAAAVVIDGDGKEFDVAALQAKLTKAIDLLDEFDKLDRAVTGARAQLDAVAKSSTKLRTSLTTTLDEAAAILAAGAGS